jgi:hypothetical protein
MDWVMKNDCGEILLHIVVLENTLWWFTTKVDHPVINQVREYSDATIYQGQHVHWLREVQRVQVQIAGEIEQYYVDRHGINKRLPRDRDLKWQVLEQFISSDTDAFLAYGMHWKTLTEMAAMLELAMANDMTIYCYGA